MIKRKRKNIKILYLIHVQPPTHGVSVVSEFVYAAEFKNFDISKSIIPINLSYRIDELHESSFVKLFRFLKILLNLLKSIIFFRPHYVYFSLMPVGKGFIKDLILVLIIKLFRRKIIFHLHNKGIHHYNKRPFYSLFYPIVFNRSSIIHLSNRILEHEFSTINLRKTKIFVLPNGTETLLEKRKDKKIKMPFHILFFANLIPDKGFITSLEALKILLENGFTNIKLTIAGSPTNNSNISISDYLKSNPIIDNHIEILGASYGKSKEDIFNQADLFIFPSRFTQECMPLVVIEAMSLGIPLIASNIGAIPDMIDDGENGFLIPPGDAESLASKIKIFLLHPALTYEMGTKAKKKYLSGFTKAHFNDNLERIMQSILTE